MQPVKDDNDVCVAVDLKHSERKVLCRGMALLMQAALYLGDRGPTTLDDACATISEFLEGSCSRGNDVQSREMDG